MKKILSAVKGYTKADYKQAIYDACDDLKSRTDDILCDFDKSIRDIEIKIKIEVGMVSLISITKNVNVECEEE